jgi:hypothetical protein
MTVQVGAGYLSRPFYDFVPNPDINGKVDFLRTVSDEHPFELCSASTATGVCPIGSSLGVLTNVGDCTTVDTAELSELWYVCTAQSNMVDQLYP